MGSGFYKFFVGTDCTDCDIKTDGTDKFVGHATVVNVAAGTNNTFAPGATNDVISMNGGTTAWQVTQVRGTFAKES